eukprot:1281592-Pyramimonas_sp.AAC.1
MPPGSARTSWRRQKPAPPRHQVHRHSARNRGQREVNGRSAGGQRSTGQNHCVFDVFGGRSTAGQRQVNGWRGPRRGCIFRKSAPSTSRVP